MKRITKRETCKNLIAWLLVVSMVLPMLPTRLVANAEDSDDTFVSSVDYDEMNKTMPTLELDRNVELLASVDFNTEGTDGTFKGGLYGVSGSATTTIDMTDESVMDDALTHEEAKSLDKEFTIVFRAQLDERYMEYRTSKKTTEVREQGVFALRKSGATGWKNGLYIGVPSRADSTYNYVYYKYQNSSGASQTTDTTYAHNMKTSDVYTTDGNWHTIAIVQDATTFSYYIDGEFIWSKAITVNTGIGTWLADDTEFEAYIGAFATDANEYESLKGHMDYYQLYKGALTAAQVALLANDEETVVRADEINRTVPSTDFSDTLLASVDFNTAGTNGTFKGGLYGVSGSATTTIDMTDESVMDDALTHEEAKSLDKEFTIVFRAQLDERYKAYRVSQETRDIREQGVFALRKSGATGWKDGLYIGVPSRADSTYNYVYYKYQNSSGASQTSDTTYAHNMKTSDVYTTDGNWHTIAIVQDTDTFTYYIDGEPKKSISITVNTGIGEWFGEDTEFEAYIGAFATDVNEYESLKGYMDYYQLYKGALTAEQIATFTNEADTTASVVRDDEINQSMPYENKIYDVDILASVDLNSTNGTFNGSTTYADATRINMTDAEVMNDELTLREAQSLANEFSVVFRAKLSVNGTFRDQPVLTLLGAEAPVLNGSTSASWNDALYLGVPNKQDQVYFKVYDGSACKNTAETFLYDMNDGVESGTTDGYWHTIAIVLSENELTYYVDGNVCHNNVGHALVEGFEIGDLFTDAAKWSQSAYIGSYNEYRNQNYNLCGLMDYYQFYKGALTADQVATLSSATEDGACETKIVKYSKSEIEAEYRIYNEDTATYTYVAPTLNGYLFAGWYKTEDCTEASNALKAGEEVPSTVYALFVPQHILNVKAQITSNLTNDDLKDDDVGAIRFITSVDSLNYQKIGFYFDIEGGAQHWEGADNKVYGRLYYTDPETGNRGEQMSYEPGKVFCSQSKYFKTFTFYNLPESLYDTDITATPFWVTIDGTTVYGISETKTINERRTENWVYLAGNGENVETTGADAAGNGSKEAPYATLNYALENVEDGGVVCLLDDYAETGDFSWTDHNKDISITGLTNDVKLDFKNVDDNGTSSNTTLNIRDAVTFSGITLDFTANTRVYANCNRLKVDEDVISDTIIRVYGAGTADVTGNTDVTLLAGNYNVVYGGGDSGVDVTGNTKLHIAGNTNSEFDFSGASESNDTLVQIYGGSFKGNISGTATIYVGGDVNKSLNLNNVFGNGIALIYGGSSTSGTVTDTHVTIEGNAKFTLICGGGYGSNVTGSTNVIVSGNVNEGLPFTEKDSNKAVLFGGGDGRSAVASTATANVTVRGNANFHSIYGGGRGAKSTTETVKVIISGNVNAGTDITNHSHLTALYGGSNLGTVTNTDVTVTENAKFSYIYGAGYQDTVTNANLTIGTMGATDSDTIGVKAYGMYGGSRQGTTTNAKLIMNSGKAVQIFGGSYLADISGNTDVQLLGGTVTRRVYGGCYNDADVGLFSTTWSDPLSKVTGNTNITIGPNVTLSLTEANDKGVISGSRYKERFEGEVGTIILLDSIYSSGFDWNTVIGRQDYTSSLGNPNAYNYLVNASTGGTVYSQGDTLLIVPDVTGATVSVTGVDSSNLVANEDGTYTLTLPEIGQNEQKIITIQF